MDMDEDRKIVIDFARRNGLHPKIKFIKDEPDGAVIDLNENGMMNYVYRVSSKDGSQSIFIKHGKAKSRKLDGEVIPPGRLRLEYTALEELHSVYPGCVPEPYCFDKELNTMAMEDLSAMTRLKLLLIDSTKIESTVTLLGQTLAAIHGQTSQETCTPTKWADLKSKFRCETTLGSFMQSRLVDIFHEDNKLCIITAECQETYRECVGRVEEQRIQAILCDTFRRPDCLIHADLHRGSALASQDRVAIFDWEYAIIANPCYDLAFMLCNLFFSRHSLLMETDDQQEKESITMLYKQNMKTFIDSYVRGRNDITSEVLKQRMTAETTLFLGSLLFYRSIFVGFQQHRLTEDEKKNLQQSGTKLMIDHKTFNTWDQLIETILRKFSIKIWGIK